MFAIPRVWPTALKLDCITTFETLFLVMWLVSLVCEIKSMLICIRSAITMRLWYYDFNCQSEVCTFNPLTHKRDICPRGAEIVSVLNEQSDTPLQKKRYTQEDPKTKQNCFDCLKKNYQSKMVDSLTTETSLAQQGMNSPLVSIGVKSSPHS